ncbi:MAG: methyltransferase [Nitrososphaerota archaeon]|nr:methyltransferase [Nitrososphaerota archaeon]
MNLPVGSESPTDAITKMTFGYRNTQALYVVAKLGVADLLVRGPARCKELANELGVQQRPLFRVMRALAAQGVFTQDTSDRFGLTPVGQLLRTDVPDSLRYFAISVGEESYRAAGELLHTVRTGEVAFRYLYGKSHFEYLAENPEASRAFNLFMAQGLRRGGDALESYDFTSKTLVVDVGGGQGTLIAKVLAANPALKGVLYDLPQGVAEARAYLEGAGVGGRCQVVSGSFFDAVPPGGDVYVLSRVLHDWSDEDAKAILLNCRKAMADGGRVLVVEAVIPEGDAPSFAKERDLTMLFMLGGMERTEREWRSLFAEAGLAVSKIVKTGKSLDLIEGAPTLAP